MHALYDPGDSGVSNWWSVFKQLKLHFALIYKVQI